LAADDQARVAAHVEGCPACRSELREWEQIAGVAHAAEARDGRAGAPGRPGDTPPPAAPSGGNPFAHLAWPKAPRYRRILEAFAAARARFVVHLRPDDVAEALGVPPDDVLAKDLDALVGAGNLRDAPDTSRVTSVEDFARRRRLYALTREGEAVEAALATYATVLARRAELQAVALDDIRTGLRALTALAAQEPVDAGRAAATLRELETVFTGLADNAAAFMASLTRSIDTAADGVDAFLAYKDRLLGYLQRFIGDLVVASAEIGASLRTLDGSGVDRLLVAAARRQAADAAPGADVDVAAAEARHLDAWRARWAGLQQWFLGAGGSPSQAELLRARARAAIPDLLETVAALHDRRAGRSDRAADFAELARWFAQAPSDADAHRLWRAAFGLASARHLQVDATTLDARREAEPVPPSTPWSAAPRVRVSARLRRTGSYQRRGPSPSTDRSRGRAELAARMDAERAETAAARARLATGRPLRLSDLAVDADTFPLLLRVLGDALAATGPDGVAETTTTDGTLLVRLEPAGDGRLAELHTPGGVLRGPDHMLTIHDLLDGGPRA